MSSSSSSDDSLDILDLAIDVPSHSSTASPSTNNVHLSAPIAAPTLPSLPPYSVNLLEKEPLVLSLLPL